MLIMLLGLAAALASRWAAVVLVVLLGVLLRRVVVEERFLGAQLPGYDGYRQRVRHRLVPGVW
jgi:protein-S-isoprenylcysteine O-methyltransferase Ste14